jgi:hypothetical protein
LLTAPIGGKPAFTFIHGVQRLTFTDDQTIEEHRRPSVAAVNAIDYLKATEAKLTASTQQRDRETPSPALLPDPVMHQPPQSFFSGPNRHRGPPSSYNESHGGGFGFLRRGQSPYNSRRDGHSPAVKRARSATAGQ